MIQGRKFAFKWTVKDFAESNSIELEVAKRLSVRFKLRLAIVDK